YDAGLEPGGTLFFGGTGVNGIGQVHAVDPATGDDRWPPVDVGKTHGNLAVANGLLFVNGGPAGLAIFDAARGSLLRTLVPEGAGASYSGVAGARGAGFLLSGSPAQSRRPALNFGPGPGEAPAPPPAPGRPRTSPRRC